jgi:hypothetical protein
VNKAKSVGMSEEGFLRAKELFERHFAKNITVIPLPEFTADAQKRWDQVPQSAKKKIMDNVWCGHCLTGISMQLREGNMSGRSLILHGTCGKCGGEVARVIEDKWGHLPFIVKPTCKTDLDSAESKEERLTF